ncbi:hypothetical protein J3F83DRAFT_534323 [Trichoderma novae-zelandiae]
MGLDEALSHLASSLAAGGMDGHGQIHDGGASVEETAERNSRILPRMARAISARMHWPSASPRSQPDAQTAETKRLSLQCPPGSATATTERRARKRRCHAKPCGRAVVLWPSHRCLDA